MLVLAAILWTTFTDKKSKLRNNAYSKLMIYNNITV